MTEHLIVCPVDFSNTSKRGLKTAVELAARLAANVRVIHVFQLPASALAEDFGDAPVYLEATLAKQLRNRLEAFVKESVGERPGVTTGLCEGVPCVEISSAADKLGADMIVIGTHGRTGLAHLLHGSVAERVLRRSHVPVVTVRGC